MSFVNLMASDVWSSADIDNKVQALIRSRYSEQDELKAARLARTGDNPDFVAAVDGWIAECVQQGREARTDMALLGKVLAHEQAAAIAKQAHALALAWNKALVAATLDPETGEVIAELDESQLLDVPDLLPDPVPGDEIHDLWLARNPPAPEVVELEEEPALLPE